MGENTPKREIRGTAKTVREILGNAKYSVDYFQREYKWTTKQVSELIDDLTLKFLEYHDESHDRQEVVNYGHYFLGAIVINDKNGLKYIIDGQQRLTTLTLVMMYLHNLQKDRDDKVNIASLIFSERFGKRSFNLDIPDRSSAMEGLFTNGNLENGDQSESVRNIIDRYKDIENLFPEDVKDISLPYFIDWLIDNVHLVEIIAYADEDAYTIFETMNDRGLSLTPTDMLKGYLLANITNEEKRIAATINWKQLTGNLLDLGQEEVSDFFKAWLRGQYAQSIRERKKGAKPEDFDRIGTEFHRWVREHEESLKLTRSDDFARFIQQDINYYARQYLTIRQASQNYTKGLESLLHVAQLGFTLQYPLLLAPLKLEDDDLIASQKMQIVATYIEITLARRIWNWRSISYNTMQYAMFLTMRDIRGKDVSELVDILTKKLDAQAESFSSNERFSIHKKNRFMAHRLLARMTDYVERLSGLPSHYLEYVNLFGDPRNPFEVEHIWANHPERHQNEFDHPADFGEYRNRIGGLLLLPKKFNASYGDLPYEGKYEHYFGQNLLAKSLNARAYEHNTGFHDFIQTSGIDFKPCTVFNRADLDNRQAFYIRLAEQVWSPERLKDSLK
jgi:uncharacterized protein with ParB-like and HNH nuclease domain